MLWYLVSTYVTGMLLIFGQYLIPEFIHLFHLCFSESNAC